MSNQPLLTCRKGKDTVQVFLATKGEASQNQGKEFYLVGKGNFGGRQVNFNDTTREYGGRTTLSTWTMKVNKHGVTELFSTEGSGHDFQGFTCSQKNIFKVLSTYSKYGSYSGDWEESVTTVKLTLEGIYKEVSGKQEWDVKISDNVGLQWSSNFKPKVILST